MIKPILFNTEMVQAIQSGAKTVTRRVVKPQPEKNQYTGLYRWKCFSDIIGENELKHKLASWLPDYHPGDVLWVRETWADYDRYYYKATEPDAAEPIENGDPRWFKWRPSIHMPKDAARLFLRVKDVRVERLQDILKRPGEVAKEGIPYADEGDREASGLRFKELWDTTIKPADLPHYGWDANPWVWVIEYERCEKPAGWPGEGER